MKHPNTPAALVPQHAPRHGFGVHVVWLTTTPFANGHGIAVEHAPVAGSQHTCVGVVRQGGICAQVRPRAKIKGGGQCVASGWMLHNPVAGSQQAP